MMKLILHLVIITFFISCASIKKEDMSYEVKGVKHSAHIASGAKEGEKKPGIIIVHEWWGHNDYARSRADMLARQGYVAMSIDMYGEGKQAHHPDDAGKFAKQATKNFKLAKKRFTTALNILKKRDDVDPDKIAAIGYCFGGGVVLNMARAGVDIDLVASFHGALKSKLKAKRKKVKAQKILDFNGANDPMVTKKDIKNFKREMKRASVDYEFYNYENAVHAFTNKGADELGEKFKLPLAYNKKADQDSWKVFLTNLKELAK